MSTVRILTNPATADLRSQLLAGFSRSRLALWHLAANKCPVCRLLDDSFCHFNQNDATRPVRLADLLRAMQADAQVLRLPSTYRDRPTNANPFFDDRVKHGGTSSGAESDPAEPARRASATAVVEASGDENLVPASRTRTTSSSAELCPNSSAIRPPPLQDAPSDRQDPS